SDGVWTATGSTSVSSGSGHSDGHTETSHFNAGTGKDTNTTNGGSGSTASSSANESLVGGQWVQTKGKHFSGDHQSFNYGTSESGGYKETAAGVVVKGRWNASAGGH